MLNDHLISTEKLAERLGDENTVIVDCTYDTENRKTGYQQYIRGHIPGAWYAHLEDDLSGVITQSSCRYPLPNPKSFQRFLQSLGITPNSTIIAYDNNLGVFAARFWWLAKCYGHKDIRILDGGMANYQKNHTLSRGLIPAACSNYPLHKLIHLKYFDAQQLLTALENNEITLIDVRSKEKSLKKTNALSRVINYDKKAINIPYSLHLDQEGKFLSQTNISHNFVNAIVEDKPLVLYCDTGIASYHSFFSLSLAGLHGNASVFIGK